MELFSKEKSKRAISDLVEKFEKGKKFYKSTDYKEANLEDDFLKPFLRALNWNVSNEGIHRAADREVIVQAKGKHGKEPDYLLQLDQKPYFYIEAKHPRYKLHHEVGYMWQAYSYAYSTQSSSERRKVDFSLLTDFEEFRFFDCTFKADLKTVNNFVSVDWLYTDYLAKFPELWDLFEKEQIRKGSLKSLYLNEKKIRANRVPPDKAFLDDLDNEKDGWRVRLAKDIKKYSPQLDAEFITTAVQLILDRLIFLKVLSDREIENDFLRELIETLDKAALKSEEGYIAETLKETFANLNNTYNGSIFAPRPELEKLTIGNKVLLGIVTDLSPENSRYNFKQIPVEILGTIYERFLGKVVTTSDQRVKIEYKPEVRKAGGVYYTPQFIVDYIVDNTLGQLLKECRSIEDLLKIKICDPACGSGSFLLGAYDRLLTWALYFLSGGTTETAKKRMEKAHNKEFATVNSSGDVKLTAKLKRQILTSCIFGVDLDEQAVEVAKVSLSLKALENATHDELREEMFSTKEKVLPSLEENIRCGNSLIGKDIYEKYPDPSVKRQKTEKLLQANLGFEDDPWRQQLDKLKPFDWPTAFPQVFRQNGFSVVIGNPPYILIQDIFRDDTALEYFRNAYHGAAYKIDTYHLFIEKFIQLLQKHAIAGLITPSNYLTNNGLVSLRRFITESCNISELNIITGRVFQQASVDTCLSFFTSKDWPRKGKVIRSELEDAGLMTISETQINLDAITSTDDYLLTAEKSEFDLEKCFEVGEGFNVNFGMQLRDRKVFTTDVISVGDKGKTKFHQPCYTGSNMNRYKLKYENLLAYVNEEARKGGCWDQKVHKFKNKIIIRQIGMEPLCAIDTLGYHCLNSVFMVTPKEGYQHVDMITLLAILNSKFIKYYWRKNFYDHRKTFPKIKGSYIEKLPIPKAIADKKSSGAIASHQAKLGQLVTAMISHQNVLSDKQKNLTAPQMQKINDDIAYTDKQIDNIIYELYELTQTQIKIVESLKP
ncbi:MAG: TaqI-like C-terminal specificity domain-containing protein [Turneriella sp.]